MAVALTAGSCSGLRGDRLGEPLEVDHVVVVGDTDARPPTPLFGDTVTYELLCRRHYRSGRTGPDASGGDEVDR